MPSKPPKPPGPKKPRGTSTIDPYARALAQNVREGHGVDQASTLDMSESIAMPRGFVGTRNIALDRALGARLPLGRITEISGWEGSGKSTMLDQILAQCQADGGIGVLADTERTRNRAYMSALGVKPESLVWIGGATVELMFDEIETLARTAAHYNCIAWVEALQRAGVKCLNPKMYTHEVLAKHKDRRGRRKVVSKFKFARWDREQAAALLQYQKEHDLDPSSIRDPKSRAALRPVVLYGTEAEKGEALAAWLEGEEHPGAQMADRPIVVGWDSVAGTPTEREMDGDSRDQHPAVAASVIKKNLRRLVQLLDDAAIGFILVNQRYEKIPMGRNAFSAGGSETYGGSGIKYHTTIRLELDKVGDIYSTSSDRKNNIPPVGQVVRIKVPKNKLNDPYHKEEYGLIFGRGAENAWAIYQDLKARGIVRVGGGWSKFTDSSILGEDDRSFRGWQDMANMMAEDRKLWEKLRKIYMEGR